MTEEIINSLPDLFKNNLSTMKRVSLDDSQNLSMCESTMKVINFDKIPKEYARGRGWPNIPNSNDALYIGVDGQWHFIEFKNGCVDKADIYRKLYDSLLMLTELGIIPDINFAREKVHYILVYNSQKYNAVSKSVNRDANFAYFTKLSKTEERLFDIDRFEKYLFNETHTYSKEDFQQKFINPMEKSEEAAAV